MGTLTYTRVSESLRDAAMIPSPDPCILLFNHRHHHQYFVHNDDTISTTAAPSMAGR